MDTLQDNYTLCPYCDRYIPKDNKGIRQHALNCTTRLITGEPVENFLEDIVRDIERD